MICCLCASQCNFQEHPGQCNDSPCGDKHSAEAPLGGDEGAAQGSDEVPHK